MAWSTDGAQIVLAGSAEDKRRPDLYAVGSDGGGLRQLTDTAGGEESPDGRSLVFERTTTPLEETPSTADTELWVVDVDSGEERRLVAAPALEPFWSPATEAP